MTDPPRVAPVPSPPDPTRSERMKYRWRSQVLVRRYLLRLVLPLAGLAVFFASMTARHASTYDTIDIFVGAAPSNGEPKSQPWAVLLAVVGYLLIPALASTVFGVLASKVVEDE